MLTNWTESEGKTKRLNSVWIPTWKLGYPNQTLTFSFPNKLNSVVIWRDVDPWGCAHKLPHPLVLVNFGSLKPRLKNPAFFETFTWIMLGSVRFGGFFCFYPKKFPSGSSFECSIFNLLLLGELHSISDWEDQPIYRPHRRKVGSVRGYQNQSKKPPNASHESTSEGSTQTHSHKVKKLSKFTKLNCSCL